MNVLASVRKHFELYIKVSWQTLSKAFDKFRKNPVRDLHQTLCISRALSIIVGIRKNYQGESPADYWSKDHYLNSKLNITFSKMLAQIGSAVTSQ